MKKAGVILIFILLLFTAFVVADTNTTTTTTTTTPTSSTSSADFNQSKIEDGYKCLDTNAIGKCSSLSVSDISLVLLSNPNSNLTSECKDALMAKKSSSDCWPSSSCTIKDTALATLALDNLGEDTKAYQTWLLSQNRTPTDIIWYLEQDSENATKCKITYSGSDNTVNVGDNKKLDADAGSCLTRAQSNFWLQVSSSCYDKEFAVSCDKQFISTLLYKHESSPTIYVSSDTKSAPALGTTTLKITAKCFGRSSCDYEGSLWATLALMKTGNDVNQFIPYIIALSEVNKKYLPNSFIYLATNYEDYATRLIQEQRTNNWEADSTPYGKYYDTGLALLSLKSSSSTQVNQAKLWLQYAQDTSTGCWNGPDKVRDTAMILWALTSRTAIRVTPTTTCNEGGFFCIASPDCAAADQLPNYYCPGLSPVCCKTNNIKRCAEYSGVQCEQGKVCDGIEKKASDTDYCCLSQCTTPPTTTQCEDNGAFCKDACAVDQETVSYTCSGNQICCKQKENPSPSYLWLWILLLIIAIIAVIAFLLRDKIKLWWFNFRNKVKKEPSGPAPPARPGFPPRPFLGPGRPMPPMQGRPMPPQGRPMPPRPMPQKPFPAKPLGKEDDTFKKLREMSK